MRRSTKLPSTRWQPKRQRLRLPQFRMLVRRIRPQTGHCTMLTPSLPHSWANATEGQACVFDNRAYESYAPDGSTYATIISRDKWVPNTIPGLRVADVKVDSCVNGQYCDGTSMVCMKDKAVGDACQANKEHVITFVFAETFLLTSAPSPFPGACRTTASTELVARRQTPRTAQRSGSTRS